jgi:virginiamycin A acetyltransferase
MGNLIVGKHSYADATIVGDHRGKVIVGKYCSFGDKITVLMSHDHNINNISTFPFGHHRQPITRLMKKPWPRGYNIRRKLNVNIGNDVWIGYGSILFRGITIGDGAVIGAYSIITKDIPPYAIAVGQSRVLRNRFSDEDIEFLLKLKWWDFDDEVVASIGHILCSPDITALREWSKENGYE